MKTDPNYRYRAAVAELEDACADGLRGDAEEFDAAASRAARAIRDMREAVKDGARIDWLATVMVDDARVTFGAYIAIPEGVNS